MKTNIFRGDRVVYVVVKLRGNEALYLEVCDDLCIVSWFSHESFSEDF